MTRNGKIVRLPRSIREELNRRLDNGEQGKALVEWLNSPGDPQAHRRSRPLALTHDSGGFRSIQPLRIFRLAGSTISRRKRHPQRRRDAHAADQDYIEWDYAYDKEESRLRS
jgi:hypothetical protein